MAPPTSTGGDPGPVVVDQTQPGRLGGEGRAARTAGFESVWRIAVLTWWAYFRKNLLATRVPSLAYADIWTRGTMIGTVDHHRLADVHVRPTVVVR